MKISFTLRDLFWLVLVIGLALGWGLHWWRTQDARQLAMENEMWRRSHDAVRVQLELEGYTIVHSSIGPFLQKNNALPIATD